MTVEKVRLQFWPCISKFYECAKFHCHQVAGEKVINDQSFHIFFLTTLTISMRGQRATGRIQRNNYHHGSCGPSLTGKTMSVFLIFTQGMHRNVKNR